MKQNTEQERQWGPALGLVGGTPTIATGKNYGDVTIGKANFYLKFHH